MRVSKGVAFVLVGAALLVVAGVASYWYIVSMSNRAMAEVKPITEKVVQAAGDYDQLSGMTDDPKYNNLALTWILYLDAAARLYDVGQLSKGEHRQITKRAVVNGALHTSHTDLSVLIRGQYNLVVGIDDKTIDAIPHLSEDDRWYPLDLPLVFVSEWDSCRRLLGERYYSYVMGSWRFFWDSVSDPNENESLCPGLKTAARNIQI